ncbi:MAG: MarR family transcriptional regulator [Firmicutes bacterium]|nr:MarR family transcriptional regulator [Bacillota bacterium]MCL5012802.1 MarR family transcriptional regulator [Bacillota bacterium]
MSVEDSIDEQLFEIMDFLKPRHLTLPISLPHLAMLRWLYRNPALSISAAAEYSQVSQSAMTQAAQKLEREGWVVRRRDDTDQRVVWISLTPEGRKHVESVEAMQHERLRRLIACLDNTDKENLSQILAKIQQTLRQKEGLS